jgi:hypothetical protein
LTYHLEALFFFFLKEVKSLTINLTISIQIFILFDVYFSDLYPPDPLLSRDKIENPKTLPFEVEKEKY